MENKFSPKDLKRLVEQISREKGIDKSILLKAVEEALRTALKKKLGPKRDLEIHYDDDAGELEVFEFKRVVEKVKDPDIEISLKEAKKYDPEIELGDDLGLKLDTSELGRIAAQSAKQVIIQRIKDAEQEVIYEDFKTRKGEIVNGIIHRFDRGHAIVNLGRTEAILPLQEQSPTEVYRQGDRIRALIIDVRKGGRLPQIVLSRTHPDFLKALFQLEVPEIADGTVKIMNVVREPGSRAKIAVSTSDSNVDPVGACVGVRGARVHNIVQELKGEKIDIVVWNIDPARFVCNALAPAEITRVIIDENKHAMEVIVPDDQLSLAIGRNGQNVRLASKLVGWKIDVKSESKYGKMLKEGYLSLLEVTGVGEITAESLWENGIRSALQLAESRVEDLVKIEGISEKKAEKLIEGAREYLEAQGIPVRKKESLIIEAQSET